MESHNYSFRNNSSSNEEPAAAPWWHTEEAVLVAPYAIILLLAVLGNGLVILTLAVNQRMRTVTNLFLLNLAVSDLLLGVFCMPFTLAGVLLREFVFGQLLCNLIPYLQAVSVCVSDWTLVAMSVERYYAICEPLRSRSWQTPRHAQRTVATVWTISFLLMLPIALLSELRPIRDSRRFPQVADAVNPMESTALAGDAQDTDADSRTMDVQDDDDESSATTESEEGWHTVHYGRRRKPGPESVRDAGGCHGANNKVEPGFEDVYKSARHRDPENDNKEDPAPVQGTAALQAPTPVPGRDRRLRNQQTRTGGDLLYEQLFTLFLDVLLLVLPLLIMVTTYARIAATLRSAMQQQQQRQREEATGSPKQNGSPLAAVHPAEREASTPLRMRRVATMRWHQRDSDRSLATKQRIIRMLFVVVVEFFVCWTPLYVLNTVSLFRPEAVYYGLGYRGICFLQLLAYASSCCNPITYSFMNRTFRVSFLSLCHRRKPKQGPGSVRSLTKKDGVYFLDREKN
ncbi:hypothetical protein MRX96_022756 [Rhipicephalus microplus]